MAAIILAITLTASAIASVLLSIRRAERIIRGNE